MARGGTCRCEALELQEEFLTQDIGTVYIKIKKRKVKNLVEDAEIRDGTLHFEKTSVEKSQEGFPLMVEIDTPRQAYHLYRLMGEHNCNHQFVPRKERILFDSPKLTSDPEAMQELVDMCKEEKLAIVYLKPRKRLSFECFDLWEIYKLSKFCLQHLIYDGRFFCTEMEAIQKRVFVRHHIVDPRDYS